MLLDIDLFVSWRRKLCHSFQLRLYLFQSSKIVFGSPAKSRVRDSIHLLSNSCFVRGQYDPLTAYSVGANCPPQPGNDRVEVPIGKYTFTDEDRIAIVSEYVGGRVPARQIVEKYHLSSRQVLFSWMDKFVNEKELVSLSDETNPSDPMAKKSPEDRVKELEAENKQLQKALELEKLRSKAYNTMIDVAEETFNIPIRKKAGTKQ